MSLTLAPPTHSGYPDFLLAGAGCECDLDVRCENHDRDAEEAYWHAQWVAAGRPVRRVQRWAA